MKITEIEKQEIGYLEKASNDRLDEKTANSGSGNYTKYMRDTFSNLQGMAWCCAFQMWCFMKAYGKSCAIKMLGEWTAKCSTLYEVMRRKGQIVKEPKEGDLVFFNNPISHIGYVYKTDNWYIYTIEGNTSGGDNQVVAQGDGVKSKKYSYTNPKIYAYGRPKYDTENQNKKYIELTATNVNVREGAGTNFNVVGRADKGDKLELIEIEMGKDRKLWAKTEKGYIREDFVKVIGGE